MHIHYLFEEATFKNLCVSRFISQKLRKFTKIDVLQLDEINIKLKHQGQEEKAIMQVLIMDLAKCVESCISKDSVKHTGKDQHFESVHKSTMTPIFQPGI